MVPFAFHHARVVPLLLVLAIACTDSDSVTVPRPPFNPPPDEVNGFLGLFDPATNQTTCGSCHVGLQGEWVATGHARAYEGLVGNVAEPQAFCYGCHTLSERGNAVGLTGNPGGWNVVQHAAYHNVQCESCHGPGLAHVRVPDNTANQPLARVGVRDSAASCAACHSGAHQPFVEQWAASGHADSANMAGPGANPNCMGCHEGRAVIRRFTGKSSNYVERDYPVADNMTITCAVCHDPHGSPYSASLRQPIDNPDITVNLCMQCHNRNAQPGVTFTVGSSGPHASQGGVYLGQGAGWLPPGFGYDTTLIYQTTHLGGNPKLCAGCHVARFDVTAPETGSHVFSSTGHLFSPNPCLDANGVPSTDRDCAYTETARNWAGCTTSGCHTAGAAAALMRSLDANITLLLNQLWIDRNANGVLDPDPVDGGDLAVIRANFPGNDSQAFCCSGGAASDNILSVAEGALFNSLMFGRYTNRRDGSRGVHNSAFYRSLLAATITSVRATYPASVRSPLPAAVAREVNAALANPAVRYTRSPAQ